MKYNIDGRFPMMANWLLVKLSKDGMYHIKNVLTEENYELDYDTFHFLQSLDGNRNPYKIGREYDVDTEYLLDYFEENWLTRTDGRKLLSAGGTYLRTIYVPKRKRSTSIMPKLYNLLLMIGWLPVFLLGVYRLLFASCSLNSDFMLLGYIFALVVGLILHEISHAMSCLAYGGSFLEAGVMWEHVYPGAYVMIDKSNIKSRLKRIQIDAAGVEMNLLLAGVFLILATNIELLSGFFLSAAFSNAIIALFNLVFLEGLDGCHVLGELLGLKDGVSGAELIIQNYLKNGDLKEMTANRKVIVITCVVLVLYQVLLPVIFINSVLSIIGGFL